MKKFVTMTVTGPMADIGSVLNQALWPALKESGKVSKRYFKDGFDKGGLGTEKWVPKQDNWYTGSSKPLVGEEGGGISYIKQKARTGTLGKTLKNSIRYRTKRHKEMSVYSDSPYATYNQEGTSRAPARPFIGQTKELDKLIHNIFNEEIRKVYTKNRRLTKKII